MHRNICLCFGCLRIQKENVKTKNEATQHTHTQRKILCLSNRSSLNNSDSVSTQLALYSVFHFFFLLQGTQQLDIVRVCVAGMRCICAAYVHLSGFMYIHAHIHSPSIHFYRLNSTKNEIPLQVSTINVTFKFVHRLLPFSYIIPI